MEGGAATVYFALVVPWAKTGPDEGADRKWKQVVVT
jgi:hypothetical protein